MFWYFLVSGNILGKILADTMQHAGRIILAGTFSVVCNSINLFATSNIGNNKPNVGYSMRNIFSRMMDGFLSRYGYHNIVTIFILTN